MFCEDAVFLHWSLRLLHYENNINNRSDRRIANNKILVAYIDVACLYFFLLFCIFHG